MNEPKIFRELGKSGCFRSLRKGEIAGSNPAFPTSLFANCAHAVPRLGGCPLTEADTSPDREVVATNLILILGNAPG
jgi:hypothetical protein